MRVYIPYNIIASKLNSRRGNGMFLFCLFVCFFLSFFQVDGTKLSNNTCVRHITN